MRGDTSRLLLVLAAFTGALALFVGAGAPSGTEAHGVVDQSLDTPAPIASGVHQIHDHMPIGQEFTPSASDLVAVDVFIETMNPSSGGDTLTVRIREGHILGPILGSAKLRVSLPYEGPLHFDLPSVIPLIPGSVYVVELAATRTTFGWSGTSDMYPRGRAVILGEPVISYGPGSEGYGWDFLFRTYTSGVPGGCEVASRLGSPLTDSRWTPTQPFANYLSVYGGKTYNGYHSGEDWGFTEKAQEARIYTVGPGKVVELSSLGSLGRLIAIEHNGSFTIPAKTETVHGETYQYPMEVVSKVYSIYVHVSPSPGLQPGQCVAEGEQIATLANIAAPHLHFEIRHPSQVHSKKWDLVGSADNWQTFPGTKAYNGYYIHVQAMVDAGVRHPTEFLDANQ